jgi:fumarate reductase subunit D
MLLKLIAPEGQKRSAAPVHGILFCKPGLFTAQVAPFYVVGFYTRVIGHT